MTLAMKLRVLAAMGLFAGFCLPVLAEEILVDPEPKGYASGVYGQVMILEPESEEAKPLADSDPVFEGSRITVSENSFASVSLLDGSEIKIDEMTQVDMSKAKADLESMDRLVDVSMLYGSIRSSVQDGYSARSVFRITTPVAVAGVRGTDFAVDYESEDESTVDVFDGEVSVAQDASEESVESGESAKSSRGKGVSKASMERPRPSKWEQFEEAMNLHGRDRAESVLRERIDRVRAADPNDPRLTGLENALSNVSQTRADARARFERVQEQMKSRRQERLERMREFAKKHGRARFEQMRRFKGRALSPEERRAAAENMRGRRENLRQKAAERQKERREKIREDRERGRENIQERRENRGNRRENIQERRQKARERRGR